MPPTPDNPYDKVEDKGPTVGGVPVSDSYTPSTIDIWGLGDYGKKDHKIIFGQVSVAGQNPVSDPGLARHLPGEDREGIPTKSKADRREISDLMKLFAGLAYTPDGASKLEDYQRRLYAAGFYGSAKPEDVAWGSFDQGTETAVRNALIKTYQIGEAGAPVSFDEYIDKTAADRAKGQGQQAATPHQLTNPRVIASVLQQTAQNVLGRNLSKDEVEHFVSDYTATEEEYFKAADSANAGGNPLIYQPPSVDIAAQDTISEQYGAEAGGNRASDYLGVLQNLLGQGSLPAPEGAPVAVRP